VRQPQDRPARRCARVFQVASTDHLVSHYPAPYPAAENEYRVPIYVRDWRTRSDRRRAFPSGRAGHRGL
jgi:hypothetical protein